MKTLYGLAAILLMLPALASAEAYELSGGDLRLPVSYSGDVSFKGCDNCSFQRARLAEEAEFLVNGEATGFDQLRKALSEAPNRGKTLVTVITEEDGNRIRLISIRIR